jgi:hypothetical protein
MWYNNKKERYDMEVNSSNNPYLQIAAYQRPMLQEESPSIQPIPKPEDGPSILPIPQEEKPQKPLLSDEQKDALLEYKAQEDAKEQEQRDALRQYAIASIGIDSKKTQFKIYMTGMLDEEVDITNDFTFLESLREIQKQNEAVRGYAVYKELQQELSTGLIT